jgi:hypothetical protein
MSDPSDTVERRTILQATIVTRSANNAALVTAPELKGKPPLWIPWSGVHADSEVWWTEKGEIKGRTGKLILTDWCARMKKLGLD